MAGRSQRDVTQFVTQRSPSPGGNIGERSRLCRSKDVPQVSVLLRDTAPRQYPTERVHRGDAAKAPVRSNATPAALWASGRRSGGQRVAHLTDDMFDPLTQHVVALGTIGAKHSHDSA